MVLHSNMNINVKLRTKFNTVTVDSQSPAEPAVRYSLYTFNGETLISNVYATLSAVGVSGALKSANFIFTIDLKKGLEYIPLYSLSSNIFAYASAITINNMIPANLIIKDDIKVTNGDQFVLSCRGTSTYILTLYTQVFWQERSK